MNTPGKDGKRRTDEGRKRRKIVHIRAKVAIVLCPGKNDDGGWPRNFKVKENLTKKGEGRILMTEVIM